MALNGIQGHGDPLLSAVKLHHPELLIKDNVATTMKGIRGVGERHGGCGDPLFLDSERYHQDENDHVVDVARNVALHERLLKRNKHNSLFVSHDGSTYDPILREYIMPKAQLAELKSLEADIENKRGIFREMSLRKRKNLTERELYCDPLVNSYRMKALLYGRDILQVRRVEASKSTYRKLNQGDPLFSATKKVSKANSAVKCIYRKVNAGDNLFDAIEQYPIEKTVPEVEHLHHKVAVWH